MPAIARHTGTDASRTRNHVTAIGRAIGPHAVKVMVNNRFRSGTDVIADLANSVVTIDVSDTTIDGWSHGLAGPLTAACAPTTTRTISASDGAAGRRTRLSGDVPVGERPARDGPARRRQPDLAGDPEHISARLEETSLTWLGPRENVHEQANILIEGRAGVVSLYLIQDLWSLTRARGPCCAGGGDHSRGGVRPGRTARVSNLENP
jgi:hypothetical protein